MESEGHEEKYRAVIDGGCPEDEPVGQRWARSSLHYGGEGVLIHPPHQGVCGRHGTEEQCVTSGGLTQSPDGTGVNEPISASEVASDAASVVGRLRSTSSAVKVARPRKRRPNGSGKAAGEDDWEELSERDEQGREGGTVP